MELPATTKDLLAWSWPDIEPQLKALTTVELNEENLTTWLKDWSDVSEHIYELYTRLYIATTIDTEDEAAEEALKSFLDTTFVEAPIYQNQLRQKLLKSGLEPAGFDIALRNMRSEADLFREQNLPLFAEEQKINTAYDKLNGARTIIWEGEEKTIPQMGPVFVQEKDRSKRETAWRLVRGRILEDRAETHALWRKYFPLREQIAANADKSDYRSFAWQQKLRFDYNPEDCKTFHAAIEAVVVPAAKRVYERRRGQMGLDTLRPWDMAIDPLGRPPLNPFENMEDFTIETAGMFDKVDPVLGRHFRIMMEEELLDLENRKGKAPGAYCADYPIKRQPFIFMNAVGLHSDVATILHEAGHAFHVFESGTQTFHQQIHNIPMEFAEVASMSMELLAAPYLAESSMYTKEEAARARIEHLESLITFWPYMALVDAFQHWIYENPKEGRDPEKCDEKWNELWDRFMPGIDYTGIEQYKAAQWHRQLHIHQIPFYYIEYGLAQLGAVQVWGNALQDQAQAVKDYRKALALGSTAGLTELFKTAGANFTFDAKTLKTYTDLIESEIAGLSETS